MVSSGAPMRSAAAILLERAEHQKRIAELDVELAEALAEVLAAPGERGQTRRRTGVAYARQTHEVSEMDAMRARAALRRAGVTT